MNFIILSFVLIDIKQKTEVVYEDCKEGFGGISMLIVCCSVFYVLSEVISCRVIFYG